MAWGKDKVEEIKKSATGGVVGSLISGQPGSKVKKKSKLANFRCDEELYKEFEVYCKTKGSDVTKVLVAFMLKTVEENAERIAEFKKNAELE